MFPYILSFHMPSFVTYQYWPVSDCVCTAA